MKLKGEPLAVPKEKGLTESVPNRERPTWPQPDASSQRGPPLPTHCEGWARVLPAPSPLDLFPVRNHHIKHAVENLLKWCHESILIKCVHLSPTTRFSPPKKSHHFKSQAKRKCLANPLAKSQPQKLASNSS